MGTTSSLRIDDDLHAAAKQAGTEASRSAAQQVAHRALLGPEMEKSHNLSTRDVADGLAGSKAYHSLLVREQPVICAE